MPCEKTRVGSEDGSTSELSARSAKAQKIRFYLNRTFLNVHDSAYDPPQKPRASSEPGTEFRDSLSESTEAFWQQEMELLSDRMHQIWQDRSSDSSSVGDASDSASDTLATAQATSSGHDFAPQEGQLASAQVQTNAQPVDNTISIALAASTSSRLELGPSSLSTGLSLPRQNPGSFGHPELCPKPCLYFAQGACVRGANCEYCHLEHTKKPAHLTKCNRETLKSARFEELLALSVPLLREKVKKLGLDPEVLQLLDAMAGRVRVRKTRALHRLGDALGTLRLRCLLTSLRRTEREASPEQAELEAYVARIWTLVLPPPSAIAAEDLQDQDAM
jgi:hypothetical protein